MHQPRNEAAHFKRNDLPYLDGLRGLAALIVVADHFASKGWANFASFSLDGMGKSGVYLFFLLSSYLLTRIAMQEREVFWQPARLAAFFSRRLLRIYPLFFVFLVVCAVTSKAAPMIQGIESGLPYTLDWIDVWRHLTMQDGFGVLWSIPVEFKYYICLPVIAWILLKTTQKSALLTVFLLVLFCALVEFYLETRDSRSGGIFLRAYIQIFAIGSAFAVLDVLVLEKGLLDRRWVPPTAACLFAIGWLGLIFMIPSVQEFLYPDTHESYYEEYLMHAIAWCLVLSGLRYGNPWLRLPFEWNLMRSLGFISFSLYLWHEFVISSLMKMGYSGPSFLAWIVPLALALAISWVSFLLIEKPCLSISPSSIGKPFRRLVQRNVN